MSDLFQNSKLGGRGGMGPVPQILSLAAFGKHPGWNDHIEGIGVDTDSLAQAKQNLYDEGIGGQINSGAWEKLEPGKRLDGFDHTFLWRLAGRDILGQLWSSSDGKGRSKYPMVVCVEVADLCSSLILADILMELGNLRTDCKAAVSAEQVKTDCLAARDSLRLQFDAAKDGMTPPLPAGTRQRFLEHPDFAPGRMGLLRILHEFGNASKLGAQGPASVHLRVPLADGSRLQSLQMWAAFFQCAPVPASPLLLIERRGCRWMDVIIGKPESSDWFCFQASPQALPLTTEIPYDLPPALKPRLQEWEARFLGADAPADTGHVSRGLAKGSHSGRWWLAGILATAIVAVAGLGYFGKLPAAFNSPLTNSAVSAIPSGGRTSQDAAQKQGMVEGQAAFERKDYTGALARAQAVLGISSTNRDALSLKTNVEAALATLAAEALAQQKYGAALTNAQAALARNDYAAAIAQAVVALGIHTNDATAAKIKAGAEAEQAKAKAAALQWQQYVLATNAAIAALAKGGYAEATNQAGLALAAKPGDGAAGTLMTQAQQSLAAAQQALLKPTAASQSASVPAQFKTFTNNFGMLFVWVPGLPGGGGFVGEFEVTQRQFKLATGHLPASQRVPDENVPVVNVSFSDATDFCSQLKKSDNRNYALPGREDWLALSDISPAQAQDAWQILGNRGRFDKEVTSWKLPQPLTQPAPGGSRGAQTNGICDLLGNVREWDAEKESAGFSYDAGSGGKTNLLLTGHAARDAMTVTGFRCIVRGGN